MNRADIGPVRYPKPASLPSWEVGEDVLVFLHSPARLTGFRTTVGLNDGKWKHEGDYLVSTTDLSEILDGLSVEGGSLTTEQLEMLGGKKPRARFAPMMDLLRRAIDERWTEKGLLIHAPGKNKPF